MTYDEQARAEIQAVSPQLLPLYEFLVQRRVSPFDQASGNPRHVLKDIKEALIAAGVRPAVWRFLCKQEHWFVQYLVKPGISADWSALFNCRATLLALAGPAPNPRAGELILNLSEIFPEGGYLESYSALARVALAEGRRRKEEGWDVTAFVAELEYVLMWVGVRWLSVRHIPAKKTWNTDWGNIYRWATVYLVTHNEFPPHFENHRWLSLLPPFRHSGLDVVPLVSTYDLMEEAAELCHCIYSYVPACLKGVSRIFSLRKDDVWLATFELAIQDDKWRLVQLRGAYNARPENTSLCIYVARETERRYNMARAECAQSGGDPDVTQDSEERAA